jgi:hypothetical protein
MDHYWESAPVPAWTGWFVQNYLSVTGIHLVCASVIAIEALAPFLLFGGRKSKLCLFAINLALQLGIAATASYSFLNLLVIGLGFLAWSERSGPSAMVRQGITGYLSLSRERPRLRGLELPALYAAAPQRHWSRSFRESFRSRATLSTPSAEHGARPLGEYVWLV